jgi:hypothetical protein
MIVVSDSLVGDEDRSKSAGAPVNEIEITPEMTAMGIAALQEFNVKEDCLEWVVGDIYVAMFRSRPS